MTVAQLSLEEHRASTASATPRATVRRPPTAASTPHSAVREIEPLVRLPSRLQSL
jgi:hypothetical protein